MKLLWVSNSPIGPAAEIIGEEYKGSSGGWIQSEYELLDKDKYQFFFLSTLPSVKKGEVLHKISNTGELYCVKTPRLSYGVSTPRVLQDNIQEIIDKVNPDIIHIWGSETWLSNAVSKAKTKAPKVIFIQGLIGVHKRYLGGYIGNIKEDKKFLRGESLICKFKKRVRNRQFIKQAEIERETIANCKNVIVDSDFARAYCASISPDVICHQHVLLPNSLFYKKHWSLDNCNIHTIFTVYGSSAEKGTQNLLKAVSIVKRKYPDVKAIIPGGYKLDASGKLTASKSDAFQNIMFNMIKDLNIEDNVSFTGRLNPAQMAETMERCHCFVNPSCMEVHALSLREALIVGIPCISSQCGSVAEYLNHKVNGLLYRYEEYETLAYYIEKVFESEELTSSLSSSSRKSLGMLNKSSKPMSSIYDDMFS